MPAKHPAPERFFIVQRLEKFHPLAMRWYNVSETMLHEMFDVRAALLESYGDPKAIGTFEMVNRDYVRVLEIDGRACMDVTDDALKACYAYLSERRPSEVPFVWRDLMAEISGESWEFEDEE